MCYKARKGASIMDYDLTGFEWLEPWAPLPESQAREREQQLQISLVPEHPLHGRPATALGARADDDAPDVLFALGAPVELCVVSLSVVRKRTAATPFFNVYESIEEFREACMMPDHLEHTDEDTD